MIRQRLTCWVPSVAFLLLIGLVPAVRAGVVYKISVDTSGVSGSTGYVDLQFNPADPGTTPAATATVSGFTGSSGSPGVPQIDGSVSGGLGSTLTLGNTAALNAYFASVTFGASLEFLLSLDGPAFSEVATNGSSFLFSLYNSAQQPLNGSADPTAVLLDLLPNGVSAGVSVNIVTGPGFSGGPDARVTAVPEASTTAMGLLVAAAGAVTAWRRRAAA